LSGWARGDDDDDGVGGVPTKLLLVDSAYDYLMALIELGSDESPMPAITSSSDGFSSLDAATAAAFGLLEYGSRRKAKVAETMHGGGRRLGRNVRWAVTSSPLHNAILPSVAIMARVCDGLALADDGTECEGGGSDCIFARVPGGAVPVCNSTGVGYQLPLTNGLRYTLWSTTDTWKLVTVEGRSVRDVISEFVAAPNAPASAYARDSGVAALMVDSCSGPSCVPPNSTAGNPAQALIEVGGILAPMAAWLRNLVSVILALIPLAYALAICRTKWNALSANSDIVPGRMEDAQSLGVHLAGLDVFSKSGEQILDNIELDLKPSSLIYLLGKSGSGKSCLLGVLR
jgi:hypothetical protein